MGTDGPIRILVGVDGSETSMRAGAYAGGLARRQGAHIIGIYVPTMAGLMSTASAGAAVAVHQAVVTELEEAIERARADLDLSIELVVRRGDPFTEIVRVADDRRVDGVVIGASTSSGHRLVGSLAVRLVRAARWPVTVVP